MITIPNTNYKADNVSLAQILNSTTKVNMLTVCKKFDLYVSPNLKKDETARREVRDSLASSLPFYLDCAMKGIKAPSAKELRMMSMLQRLYGEGE